MPPRIALCLLLLVGRSATAYSEPSTPSVSSGPAVTDQRSLIKRLHALNIEASWEDEIDQPFFSVTGKTLKMYGDGVQAFEYPDAVSAKTDAARISRDGMKIGTAQLQWIGPPHFYLGGRLLVLYVGHAPSILKALESVLGKPFAASE